ncbi:MAG TPA: winged helix-turn-helix domain-containing protein, partial [Pseudonocardiaceae bacterium]
MRTSGHVSRTLRHRGQLVRSSVVGQPLHEQIAADLRRQIMSGELPVGGALPSEARLCEQWHGSRAPVRQALAALRAEGL